MKNWINAAVLFGFYGRWPVRGGAPLPTPPSPPALTDAQVATVNKYLGRKNYAVRRDGAGNLFVCTIGTPPPPKPFEPIEWRRAAQLQAKPPQPRPEIWAPKPKNWGG